MILLFLLIATSLQQKVCPRGLIWSHASSTCVFPSALTALTKYDEVKYESNQPFLTVDDAPLALVNIDEHKILKSENRPFEVPDDIPSFEKQSAPVVQLNPIKNEPLIPIVPF